MDFLTTSELRQIEKRIEQIEEVLEVREDPSLVFELDQILFRLEQGQKVNRRAHLKTIK